MRLGGEPEMAKAPIAFTLLLRLVPGYLFLSAGISKVQAGWLSSGDGLAATVHTWLGRGEPYSWYESFLTSTVIPNQEIFSNLVVVGEIVTGSLLLVGLMVRPASVVGLFLCANFLLAQGGALVGLSAESMLMVILCTALLVNPGRSLGVDGYLSEQLRLPRWLV